MRILEVNNWKKVALDRDEWAKLLKKSRRLPKAVEPIMIKWYLEKLCVFLLFYFQGSWCLLIIETLRSLSDTRHPVGLLWKSDQPPRRKFYLTKHNTLNR
jgi:hypothetical protein